MTRGAGPAEPVDLAVIAEDAIDAAGPAIAAPKLRIETGLQAAPAEGDPVLIERMVANLVDNAVRHNVPGGWVRVTTGCLDGTASVEVANGGRQIPGELAAALFEPFRRLDERAGGADRGDGVGLGLSIARSVAVAHHGSISATSRPDGGLEVSVRLPRAPVSSAG